MKKLDLFIVKTFVGPFLATFFISTLFFVLQLFWVFLEEITGKGLDLFEILRFTFYLSMLAVGNAFPMSILISSIMTFGTFSETSEIIGMRSAGLSFARIAMPIGVVSVLLAVVAFAFQNYVIPKSNLKLSSLRYDVISAKPAFSITQGTFYTDLDGFVVLVEKKHADNKHIEDVIIYQQSPTTQDYLMTANKGVIEEGQGSQSSLRFVLEDGSYYQYPDKSNPSSSSDKQFVQFDFGRYVKDFPLWQFENQTSDSLFTRGTFTQDVSALRETQEKAIGIIANNSHSMIERYVVQFPLFAQVLDTPFGKTRKAAASKVSEHILQSYEQYHNSESNLRNTLLQFNQWAEQCRYLMEENKSAQINKREAVVDEGKKFIMSSICIVFFLLGVPLGGIIKRGGIGLPMIFAIIVFATFTFATIFGEKFSKEFTGPNPYITPWFGTIFFFVLGGVLFLKMWGISLFPKKGHKKA